MKEEEEAEFVAHMETIQVSKLKKAIFSPRILSILVLSSIATFQDEFDNGETMDAISDQVTFCDIKEESFNDEDDDDDDDDEQETKDHV